MWSMAAHRIQIVKLYVFYIPLNKELQSELLVWEHVTIYHSMFCDDNCMINHGITIMYHGKSWFILCICTYINIFITAYIKYYYIL